MKISNEFITNIILGNIFLSCILIFMGCTFCKKECYRNAFLILTTQNLKDLRVCDIIRCIRLRHTYSDRPNSYLPHSSLQYLICSSLFLFCTIDVRNISKNVERRKNYSKPQTMYISYGTVVRDFESEAKTRCNFQFR